MYEVTSVCLGADTSQPYYTHKRWQSRTYPEDWLFDVRLKVINLNIV
jgi:hypothetical protein